MTIEHRSRPEDDDLGFNPYRPPDSVGDHETSDDPAPGSLTVTYSLTAGDVWRATAFALAHHPGRLFLQVFAVVWVAGAMALYGYLRGRLEGDPLGRAITYGAAVGLGLVILIALRMLGRARTLRAIGALGERTMTISPARVDVIDPGVGESRLNWSGLPEIATTGQAIYIYLNRVQLLMIPRRAFPSAIAADEFFSAARRWHADALAARTERSH